MSKWDYKGILPAMQVPFRPDFSIDEPELRRYTGWLAGVKGITGLVTNGHTGEVFALSAKEQWTGRGLKPAPRLYRSWWRRADSNRRPPRCERGALPAELRPQTTQLYYSLTDIGTTGSSSVTWGWRAR